MDPEQEPFLSRFKWHITVIVAVVVPVVYLTVFGDNTPSDSGGDPMSSFLLFLGAAFTLLAFLVLIWRISNIIETLKDNSLKLEEVAHALGGITQGLSEISRSTRLSESAKAIAFRDTERESLKEAVLEKLDQLDFEAADELIDEIAQRHEYGDLSDQLRKEAELKRNAARNERIEGFIDEIETLLSGYHWTKAGVRIEGLIKAYPDSARALSMRQRLHVKREEHKRELLFAWDEAVKRQDTDKSFDIIKELDMYLTPNEALALQEAAKDVFKNKLHNMGVQFSMAVSDKHWADALEVGEHIIEEFPNSRMAGEIRSKIDVLRQNVQMHTSAQVG